MDRLDAEPNAGSGRYGREQFVRCRQCIAASPTTVSEKYLLRWKAEFSLAAFGAGIIAPVTFGIVAANLDTFLVPAQSGMDIGRAVAES